MLALATPSMVLIPDDGFGCYFHITTAIIRNYTLAKPQNDFTNYGYFIANSRLYPWFQ